MSAGQVRERAHASGRTDAREVLVNGATGFLGSALVEALVPRGHRVRALVRPSSVHRAPQGIETYRGDPLDPGFLRACLRPGATLVHLIGTAHPNPAKAGEFLRIDLASAQSAVEAAALCGGVHLVYVSVAQPAPLMHAYLAARAEAERRIAAANLTATVLRPWYVLGPGRRWPLILTPFYALASLVPGWRVAAKRLGLVTREQMIAALVSAIEQPPPARTRHVLDVPAIRRAAIPSASGAAGPASRSRRLP